MANKKENWPKDRDVIFNPDRKVYHQEPKLKSCVFCNAKKTKPSVKNLVLYKSKNFMVVLNKFPYHIGHIMVMPARHIGEMWGLKEPEYIQIQLAIRESLRVLEKVYGAHGLNMGINLGKAAGAGIPNHLHYHLIPRWPGDCNFFPEIAKTRVMSESLEESYERLQKPLKKALDKVAK